jgi:hypothetical protein
MERVTFDCCLGTSRDREGSGSDCGLYLVLCGMALLPFAVGMHLGVEWSTLMTMNTIQMYTVGFFSAIALSILCQFVYVAMLSPPRTHWHG